MESSGRALRTKAPAFDPYGLVLGKVLYPAWERLRGRPTLPMLHEMLQTQWLPAEQRDATRDGFLRRLIRHAYQHTTHYRRAFDAVGVNPHDIRTVADLQALPLLDRGALQSSPEDRTAPWPPVAYAKLTSGSTGQPAHIRFSEESRNWRDATRWRGFGWGGYHMGDKAMHVWGINAAPPSRFQELRVAVDRKLRRDVYVNCLVRSPEILAGMVDTFRREKPNVMIGFAQAIGDLARYINTNGLRDWADTNVIYGAERMWPHDREEVVTAFGPEVYETYGCREFMLMGAECEAHDGLHESMENLVVEIVVREPDGSVRAARPGEQGEVAVTDLHNLAYPFIRYLNGDLAVEREQTPCPCGRTLRRFGPVAGRAVETLTDGRGNRVDGLMFNILFLEVSKYAKQFQVVQHVDRSVTLRIVSTTPGKLDPDGDRIIRGFVADRLYGVPLEILVVDEIPLSKSGKLARVIVEK